MRQAAPCDSYFGNVCTGFGGSARCWHCGWDKFDHAGVFVAAVEAALDRIEANEKATAETGNHVREEN